MSESPRFSPADIYRHLKDMILNFALYPGVRVTETELADHFGVSRTPVREALQRLAAEGYLTIRAKQGCFVRAPAGSLEPRSSISKAARTRVASPLASPLASE